MTSTPSPRVEPSHTLLGPFGRKAIRIGRIQGIDVGLDITWPIIFVLVTISLSSKFGLEHEAWTRLEVWGASLLGSLLFFTSILLHELGHSLTSNRLGLPVRSITLFIFGGMAQLSGSPKNPRDLFLIGVAGPLVSVLLGGLLMGLALWIPEAPRTVQVLGEVCAWVGFVNLMLAGFNLVPGYPLDGGHLMRALVWKVSGDERLATRVVNTLGQMFALFLIGTGILSILVLGLANGLWLVLIGWFLLKTSQGSALQVLMEDRLGRVSAREAMQSDHPRIGPGLAVQELVAEAVLRRGERSFCVHEEGRLIGLVTLHEIKSVRPQDRGHTTVREIMRPREELVTIDARDSLWTALRSMEERKIHQLPVLEREEVVGILTREQLLRVIRNQMDLGETGTRPAQASTDTPRHASR